MQNKRNQMTDWDHDRWAWALSRIRLLTILLAVVTLIAVSEGFGIAAMMPLKEIVPEIHVVDKSTGIVEIYKKPEISEIAERENVIESTLKKYLRLREEYLYEIAGENFDKCNLFNDDNQKKIYSAFAVTSNPNAPINVYGKKANVKLQFKNCVALTGFSHVWQCRYLRQVNWYGSKMPEVSHWSATVSFEYLGFPAKSEEREINNFGMQVHDYRIDREDVVKPIIPEAKP